MWPCTSNGSSAILELLWPYILALRLIDARETGLEAGSEAGPEAGGRRFLAFFWLEYSLQLTYSHTHSLPLHPHLAKLDAILNVEIGPKLRDTMIGWARAADSDICGGTKVLHYIEKGFPKKCSTCDMTNLLGCTGVGRPNSLACSAAKPPATRFYHSLPGGWSARVWAPLGYVRIRELGEHHQWRRGADFIGPGSYKKYGVLAC
jgi:hypothetical protein